MQDAVKSNGHSRSSRTVDVGAPDYLALIGVKQLPEHLSRPLTVDELEAVRIYRDYFEGHGEAIGSEKVGTVLRANANCGDFSNKNIKTLFKGLFRNYLGPDAEGEPDILLSLALKRLAGIETRELSRNECLECIRWVHEQVSGSDPKVLPTSKDIKQYADARAVVPSVGLPVPSFATILRKVGNNKLVWGQIVAIAIEADPVALTAQTKLKPTIYDFVNDYRNATEWIRSKYPKRGSQYLPTSKDLDEYMEKAGGLGWSRYKHFIRRCKEMGINRRLDDIRHLAGFDKANRPAPQVHNKEKTWDRQSIIDAYLAAWESIGFDNDPPSYSQLQDISKRQSRCLNPDNTLNVEKALENKLPTVFVPVGSIYDHFDNGLLELLNTLEKEHGVTISISEDFRINKLASVAEQAGLGKNDVPQVVWEAMGPCLVRKI